MHSAVRLSGKVECTAVLATTVTRSCYGTSTRVLLLVVHVVLLIRALAPVNCTVEYDRVLNLVFFCFFCLFCFIRVHVDLSTQGMPTYENPPHMTNHVAKARTTATPALSELQRVRRTSHGPSNGGQRALTSDRQDNPRQPKNIRRLDLASGKRPTRGPPTRVSHTAVLGTATV